MKSKELIRMLLEADPSGEIEVSYHNKDILGLDVVPAYYDGKQERLIRDEEEPYVIRGVKIAKNGRKIKILTLSMEQVLWNKTKIEPIIDLSELDEHEKKEYLDEIKKIKQEIKECDEEIAKDKRVWI